jgi:hypothetical protein
MFALVGYVRLLECWNRFHLAGGKSLTLKRVSRQLRGPHYIVQSIALSTRNFTIIHRLKCLHFLTPLPTVGLLFQSLPASMISDVELSCSAPTE